MPEQNLRQIVWEERTCDLWIDLGRFAFAIGHAPIILGWQKQNTMAEGRGDVSKKYCRYLLNETF